MKLTCPECFSEFDVPDTYIGASGRRVRCNHCARIWFQEPDNINEPAARVSDIETETEAEVLAEAETETFTRFDDGMDFDPIPPSLHPAQDDDASHSPQRSLRFNKRFAVHAAGGFVVAAAIFALLLWLGALAGLHKGPLRDFYKPFGIVHAPAPLSLAVEDAHANIIGTGDAPRKTVITAVLRNTGTEPAYIPLIEMSIVTVSGALSDAVYIKPETTHLAAGETLNIEATLPSAITEDESIRIRFIGD